MTYNPIKIGEVYLNSIELSKFPNELLETLDKKNSINKQVDIEFQQANIPGHANPRYPRLGNIFPGRYQSAFSNKCQKFYDFAGPQPGPRGTDS
ncbi:hypothetical protein K0M31_013880 [Melipona bicolor]|uniref:Uncharacterized protein n=1 Tax=Melipona bicolor TaxID=60889 RepID=A0AA40KTR9_9HYME|nr:hypothetical protein K0M31_013880 [Melipona bicolor]